jgi:RNA polymerase sigma-70 factor (ECF subfamily)
MASAPLDSRLEALLAHTDWVRSLAFELVADPSAAEDVAQEALLQAFQRPPRSVTSARGWLAKVTRNVARDQARGELRRARREQIAAREEAVAASDEATANAEQQRALIDHVLALDEVYRSVLLLRFYEGMTPREIARVQDVPRATVKTRLARGLEKLRSRLDASSPGGRQAWLNALLPIACGGPGIRVGRVETIVSKISLGAPTLFVAALVGGLWVAARWKLGWGDGDPSPVATSLLGHEQFGDASSSAEGASSAGVTNSHRESIIPPGPAPREAKTVASTQEGTLAPAVIIGEELFDPASDGPRAIAVDSDGSLFVFEYGEHGRCLIFDRSGHPRGESKDIGYCSEAVRVGTSMFLTMPSGHLVKFDTVSLSQVGDQPIADEGGHWLCNALCATGGFIYVGSGEEGRVRLFDLDLQPRGEWAAFGSLREMDARDDTIFVVTDDIHKSTVQSFRVGGTGLPTAAGDPLVVPGNLRDLCALSEHRVLLVMETGEVLQYRLESTNSQLVWHLQGQVDLAKEEWFAAPRAIARAAYDAQAEILYLSFRTPHARVVAVPYSVAKAGRVTVHR